MNRMLSQKIMDIVFTVSGAITLLILALVIGYILINGLPAIDMEFIFSKSSDAGRSGGIFPMIVSTIYLIVISISIAVPIGVGSAVYVSEYARDLRVINLSKFVSEVLASVPSIVFGLFGFSFFIMFLKLDWSIFTGGLVLALMSVPTIFQISEVTLQSIPDNVREASLGLGASKWQTITEVVFPLAIPGIATGIILALTRAISEAAAVMYVVGSSLDVPTSMFDAGRPLPLHLYVLASEAISMENAYGTAAVLIIMVLAITLAANFIINRYQLKMGVLK